jgi:hypothetical protein
MSSDINLQVPYSIAGFIGVVISIAFVFAQYFESNNTKRFNKYTKNQIKNEEAEKLNEISVKKFGKSNRLSNLIFNDENYYSKIFKSKLLLTILLVILSMSIGGFSIVLVNFLLTYTTKGPAKLPIATYFKIQILFWIFNVVGRLIASVVAFKLDTLLFFFILLISNFICILFYAIPYFNSVKISYFIIMIPLATFNAPVIPSVYMILKYIMGHVTSVLIALFGIGMATGAISAQYFTGYLLDEFKPNLNWFGYTDATSTYIIPIIILVNVSVSLLILIILIIVFKYLNKKKILEG